MPLSFIIERLIDSKAHGVLIWEEMGLESLAVSGPYGKGELDEGKYSVPRSGLMDKPGRKPFCDVSGNCWFQYIEPQFHTDRSELGIHPDGNVPGTEGCIGLLDDDTLPWYEAFKSMGRNEAVELEVINYGIS